MSPMQTDTAVSVEETPVTLAQLPELIKVPVVAGFLGVSTAQAWRMVWSGDLPSIRLSERVVRVQRQELETWLASKKSA